MFTIKPVGNAKDAGQYYSAGDNYYLSDQGELINASGWYGKGAERLGLSGIVEPEIFIQLLQGKLPSGQQLGYYDKKGELQHRPATDLTFSAPKSFSAIALVGGDKRLIEVHNKALRDTLDVIEKMAAETRSTFNKETVYEKTGNLVIARFQHTTTRELDPGLHDHGLVLNMTQREDGDWRSLSSRSKLDKDNLEHGFREIIYQNQHYFGLIYNSFIAKGACDIGYDIDIKDQYGNFEIRGVDDKYLTKISKRRAQILNRMAEKGHITSRAAEKANLDSRRIKEIVSPEILHQFWKEEALESGVNFESLIQASIQREVGVARVIEPVEVSATAIEAIDDAILHLSPFTTKMKHGDLVRMAFMFSRGTIHHKELEQEISTRINDKRLQGDHLRYYTSKALVEQEKQFVEQFKASIGNSFSQKTTHTEIEAQILSTPNSVQIVDVKGLTSEKELIESLVNLSESEGFKAHVLHVGRLQTNRLSEVISRDNSTMWKWVKNIFKGELTKTIAGFQAKYSDSLNDSSSSKDIVIVHDAQKVSYQDLMSLERIVSAREGKLVLLNNTYSTQGYSAGSPIKALKDAGFEVLTSERQEKRAFFDVFETKKAHQTLASAFSRLSKDERQKTQVVALTNKDISALTNIIRAHLKADHVISLESKEACVLSTTTLSDAQKKNAKFYEVGDLVTFKAFTSAQESYRVVEKMNGNIIAIDSKGNQKSFSPNSREHFSVTKTKSIDFSVGDELVAEKTININRTTRIERGDTLSVKEISDKGVTFGYSKTSYHFSNDELSDMSLSHNYVRKPNQINKDAKTLMLVIEGYQVNKNTLGELSEYAPHIQIFTRDKERASQQLTKEALKFTIHDITKATPSLHYRDSQYADPVIRKDLELLVAHLTMLDKESDSQKIATVAVGYATAKLAESEAAFEHKELLREAMVFAMGKTEVATIEQVIAEKNKSGELIHADKYWISKESLELENKIIENNKKEQNIVHPIASNERLSALPLTLTKGQIDAITLALTTRDRFSTVQGLAGVGKTTMMRELQNIAIEAGFKVVGLAPMHSSKDELQKAGIDSITVARFLNGSTPYPEKTVFVIDETSMIGNRDYLSLQEKIVALNARALFAGDITQLQSQSSGTPHELTVKTGTQKIALMEEIIRQEKSPILKKAVIHASNREIRESFETLGKMNPNDYVERSDIFPQATGSVINVDCYNKELKVMNYGAIYRAIANDYLSRSKETQKNTLVIAHAHEDRKEINALIRRGLQKEGRISKEEATTIRLSPRSMKSAERATTMNYKVGDILRFDADYSIAKRGEYLKVVQIFKESKELTCESKEGNKFTFNPAEIFEKGRMTVYREEEAKLATGDRIRLRLTNEGRGFVANKEYEVADVTKDVALLRNDEECMEIKLNQKEDAHWDYAYSTTALGAQGSTSNFVLALELAKRQKATTYRSHEIDITRPRMQVTVYTENQGALIERLCKLEGDKNSAFLLNLIHNGHQNLNTSITTEDSRSKQNIQSKKPLEIQQNKVSAEELNHQLTHNIERLSQHLLGKPTSRSNDSLRYGNKGSLSINENSGLWYNFETGEKGNALQLIASQLGFTDFKDTIEFAKDFLNHNEDLKPVPIKEVKPIIKQSSNKRAYALKLVSESLPIKGSVAEIYLKGRGITQYEQADLRFVSKIATYHDDKKKFVSALLSIGRNNENEVNHVQVVRLNPVTGKKDVQSKISKQTYGQVNAQPISLNLKSSSKTTYLTEGVETGLSLIESDPKLNVLALLSKSNFQNIDLTRITKDVVLCLDNDGENTFKDEIIIKSVLRLLDAGKKVSIAIPDKIGYDFNDVLIEEGTFGISKQIANIIDAKMILNSEIKAINNDQKHGIYSHLNELEKLKSLNNQLEKGVMIQARQINQLKNFTFNEMHHLHKNENQSLSHLKATYSHNKIQIQKEMELER